MSSTVFLGFPGQGHLLPSLPILAELVRRGEQVICYLPDEYRSAVTSTGATFRSYGVDFPLANSDIFARFRRSPHDAIHVQLKTSRWVLEHHLADIQAIKPSYLIHDALSSWGWYLAQTLRLPSVALFPTFVFPYPEHPTNSPRQRLRHLVARIYRLRDWTLADELMIKYKTPALATLNQLMQNRGTLNLVYTSREIQPRAETLDSARFIFVGPSVVPRANAPAFPFEQLDARPLILISLGTVFNDRPAFYKTCLRAFAASNWQIVMSVGPDTSFAQPGVAPSNFIVRPFVPQLELLKRTSVFVSHAGMNSVNESLYYNVPLVMLPQGADHPWIAGRISELGAGIRLNREELNAERLRGAVQEVLANPIYKQSAERIGASLRVTGGATQAVNEIFKFKTSLAGNA